jgi:hypothetical protein
MRGGKASSGIGDAEGGVAESIAAREGKDDPITPVRVDGGGLERSAATIRRDG